MQTNNIGWSFDQALRDVKVNAPLTAANFKFTPAARRTPAGAAPAAAGSGNARAGFCGDCPGWQHRSLVGLQGQNGRAGFLVNLVRPLPDVMPHLEKVYSQVKDKNVAVLGVCVWDEKPAYDKWVTDKKGTYDFPTAFDPAGRGKTASPPISTMCRAFRPSTSLIKTVTSPRQRSATTKTARIWKTR